MSVKGEAYYGPISFPRKRNENERKWGQNDSINRSDPIFFLPINDTGLLVYQLTFTDGSSGIFTSLISTVPEPSTLFLLAIGAVKLLNYRGRKGGRTI